MRWRQWGGTLERDTDGDHKWTLRLESVGPGERVTIRVGYSNRIEISIPRGVTLSPDDALKAAEGIKAMSEIAKKRERETLNKYLAARRGNG
jgi:hypothetical protein